MMFLGIKKFNHNLIQYDELETIEGETRYYITPYGNFPSMTSILSVLDDPEGLRAWREHVGDEEADKVVKDAIDRGNSLHDLSERYLLNDLEYSQVVGKGKVMFLNNKKYLDKIEVVRAVEIPLYSKEHKYAGRVDAVVELLYNNEIHITILDHKNSRNKISSAQYSRQKLFKYCLQCVGYAVALEEMTGIKAKKGCLVMSNFNDMNSRQYIFNIDQYKNEFFKLIEIYNNRMDLKESLYWKL